MISRKVVNYLTVWNKNIYGIVKKRENVDERGYFKVCARHNFVWSYFCVSSAGTQRYFEALLTKFRMIRKLCSCNGKTIKLSKGGVGFLHFTLTTVWPCFSNRIFV